VKKLTKYVISKLWLARTNDDLRILWSCWLLAQLACDDQKKLSHNLLEWVINVILIYNLQIMWSVPAKNSLCWTSRQKKFELNCPSDLKLFELSYPLEMFELNYQAEIVWAQLPTRNSLSWATRQKKFELNYQAEIVWAELPTRNSLSWATRQKKFELKYQTEIVWAETTHQK